jgi:hypothetical protein
MEKMLEALNAKKDKLKQLEAHRTKLKKGKAGNDDKGMPKTVEQCDAQI